MNAFKSILDKLAEQLDINALKLLSIFDSSRTIIPPIHNWPDYHIFEIILDGMVVNLVQI